MDDVALNRIVAAVALAIAGGCSTRVISDGEQASTTSGGEAENDAASEGGRPSTTTSGSGSGAPAPGTSGESTESGATAGVRFDVPEPDTQTGDSPDAPTPPEGCYDPGGGATFPCSWQVAPGQLLLYRCVSNAVGDCEALTGEQVIDDARECLGWPCGGGFVDVACGPDPADACCYWLVYEDGFICPGRPFVVDGRARLAAALHDESWARALAPSLAGLDDVARARLARAWTECGLFEHASVASFSRFVLQLLQAGAPASMVEDAQRALAEEIEHARVCFGLASAYAGHPVGPGALAVEGALSGDPEEAVVAAACEGCIGETVSAVHIAVAAERATDQAVAVELRRVASEELRHATLAWAFVRWAMQRASPSLRLRLADVFRDPARHVPRGPSIGPGIDDATLLAHGLLPRSLRRELAARALDDIVAPAAAALFRRPAAQCHA
jgi:hypothetical protein